MIPLVSLPPPNSEIHTHHPSRLSNNLISILCSDFHPLNFAMPAPQAPRAKPAKVRYFKGKPGGAVADSDSDSGEDETIPLRTTKQVVSDPSIVAGGAGRVIRPETLKDVKPKIKMDLGSVKIPDGGVSRGKCWDRRACYCSGVTDVAAIGEESDDESEEESEEETKPAFIPKIQDVSW